VTGPHKGPERLAHLLPEVIYPAAAPLAFFTYGNLPGNLTNLICRTEALRAAGPFDQSLPYAGDFEMWVRFARTHAFALHREACVYVRTHDQQASVTLNKHNELMAQLDRVMNDLFDRLPPNLRGEARHFADLTYMPTHVARTMRRLFEGKWSAVAKLATPRRYVSAWPVGVFYYFATGGLRWGWDKATRRMIAQIHALNKPV
jgi:hypothetical protein